MPAEKIRGNAMLLENMFYAFAIAVIGVFVWTGALLAVFWTYHKIRKKDSQVRKITSLAD